MYTSTGPNKTYTKALLIPFWIAHIVLLVAIIGVLGYLMLDSAGRWEYVPPVWSALTTLLAIALLTEPLEMVFHSYRILEPWLYLIFQVYKALAASVCMAVEIYGAVRGNDVAVFLWALVLIGCTAASFYGSLVYAAVVMHRHRKSQEFVWERDGRDEES